MNNCRSLAPMVLGLVAGPVLLAGCSLMVPPEEDPLYLKMTEMDNRLDRVERLTDNEGLTNLLVKLEALQKDVQQLRNDVETLQYDVEQSSGRQRDLYLDVDQRLQSIEQAAARSGAELAAMSGGAAIAAQLAVPGGSDRDNYQAAFDLMKQGQYDEAAAGFRQFLVAFPSSGLTDNAQYWLAETYYVGQNFPQALAEFQILLELYPDSGKIPDALLKIGYCNYELKAWDASRSALSMVVKNYPETTAARLASQRLDRLKSEGTLIAVAGPGGLANPMSDADTDSAPREERLRITEIFHSLQGESRPAGCPTAFIRLTGCPLRCKYCDTEYAFQGGQQIAITEILRRVEAYGTRYVCVTGGEPLAQPNCLILLKQLCDRNYRVSLETSGALDITGVYRRVTIVMDIKTPASGESQRNRWQNLDVLKAEDQLKFVIGDHADYEWVKQVVTERDLSRRFSVLLSPAWGRGIDRELADWILQDRLAVRFQMQLHKILWGEAPGH